MNIFIIFENKLCTLVWIVLDGSSNAVILETRLAGSAWFCTSFRNTLNKNLIWVAIVTAVIRRWYDRFLGDSPCVRKSLASHFFLTVLQCFNFIIIAQLSREIRKWLISSVEITHMAIERTFWIIMIRIKDQTIHDPQLTTEWFLFTIHLRRQDLTAWPHDHHITPWFSDWTNWA